MNGQNEPSIADFEELFASSGPAPAEPPAPPQETEPTEPPKEPDTPPAPPVEGEEDKPPTPPTPDQKADYAIANLRKERNAYEKTLKGIGQKLNLDPATPLEQIAEAIDGLLLQSQAKQDGVPVEVLQKIQRLESIVQQNDTDQLYIYSVQQVQNLESKYGATQDKINAMISDLVQKGQHPLEVQVDFEAEYLKRNLNDIITAQVQQAVVAERQRLEAEGKAPAPPTGGSPGGVPEAQPINSIEDLDAYFNSLIPKDAR